MTQHAIATLKEKDKKVDVGEQFGCATVVKNKRGQVLLGKRKNSYKAGWYGLPGGRGNGKEKLHECAERELLEETNLVAKQLKHLGVVKEWQKKHNFIHFIYLCEVWDGDLKVAEPDRCEGWEWFDIDDLPEQILPGHREGIALLENNTVIGDI